MVLRKIADAGLLVAVLNREDEFHAWAVRVFERETPPFYTCDAVIAEAGWRTGRSDRILQMVSEGDLVPAFNLAAEVNPVLQLLKKYERMDVADACLVRMSELHRDSKVWTVDRTDFQIYRRFGREPVPAVFPE